ncbi:hypothetical protein ABBQ38_015367 [Trebouxia sp. C0009 RCD-2024]
MSQQQPKLMSPSRSEPLPANMSAMSSPGSKPSKASGTTAGRGPSSSKTIIQTATCPEELQRPSWSIADFQIIEQVGEGHISVVLHCVDKHSGIHVAVKSYHKDRMNLTNSRQVFSLTHKPSNIYSARFCPTDSHL